MEKPTEPVFEPPLEDASQRMRASLLQPKSMIIGAVEWIALPELGVERLRARVDTGAASSALHVENIEIFQRGEQDWARFEVIVGGVHRWRRVQSAAPLSGVRRVRNTGGEIEERYAIRTTLVLGKNRWLTDINLSNRDKMRYRMLLGRSAMQQVLVNPSRLYLHAWPDIDKA